MGVCLYCDRDARVKVVNNRHHSVQFSLCPACYRSRKDSVVVLHDERPEEEKDEASQESPAKNQQGHL